MNFEIKKVESKSDLKQFVKSQWNFYNNDPNFVPPLIADKMKTLDKEKNPFYKHSQMELFMAILDGKIVGRIAAIINETHNIIHNDKVGFFGFFECIDNQQVADALFATAANCLKSRGMTHIRGPHNPSQNDEVGLLIEGFDSSPVVLMTYNPQYYMKLIDNAGFAKAKDLYAYLLDVENFMSEKLDRMQTIVRERYKVKLRNVEFKKKEQFRKDVATLKDIYNQAWEPNWGFVKMNDEEFDFLANDLKQIATPDYTFIIEANGEPAGFALALPDINVCLKYNRSGGLLGAAWNLLTKKKEINLIRIIVLGVLPKFQKTGIDSVIYHELGLRNRKHNIRYAEASWILEDNVMMNRGLTTTVNGNLYKKYRIYEKEIK